MAFLDKINQVAKNIGDKTGDAIETGKQNAKIMSEKNAVVKDLEKIGEYYYNVFATTGEIAPEVLEYCQSAKAHYDAIAAAQTEISNIKADTAAPAAPQAEATINNVEANTASEPASDIPASNTPINGAPTNETPASQQAARFCSTCGTAIEAGNLFCSKCGTKVEG